MDGKLHCGAAFAPVVSAESLAFPGRLFDVSGNEGLIGRHGLGIQFGDSSPLHPQLSPLAVLRSSQHAPDAAKMWGGNELSAQF